jgi:two-component system capsular synthesis sensor histidine kinase RcsC
VPGTTSRPRALLVDDDVAAVQLLRAGLEEVGIEVLVASDGVAALRQLVDHLLYLDLLVTDLNMPNLDGTTLVRIIRAEGGETELAILVIAATVSDRDSAMLARLGVDGIILKSKGSDAIVRRGAELARAAWARRTAVGSPTPPPGPAETPVPVPIARLRIR